MAYKIIAAVMNWLPFGIANYVWEWFSHKTTLCYSNFPGPRKGFNFGGAYASDLTGFIPCIGAQSYGILVMTTAGILKVGLMSDLANIENPDEFMEILDQKFT